MVLLATSIKNERLPTAVVRIVGRFIQGGGAGIRVNDDTGPLHPNTERSLARGFDVPYFI
jgi:hypothetical protein